MNLFQNYGPILLPGQPIGKINLKNSVLERVRKETLKSFPLPRLTLFPRHETPVLSKPIEVVHLSEELVVLDKPCSLPVSSRPSPPSVDLPDMEKAVDITDTHFSRNLLKN